MRPKSVERFELLFLVSLGVGVVNSTLLWEQLAQMGGAEFTLIVQAVTLLIVLGMVLLVSRKGSNIARWVLVVFFVLGTIMYIPSMAGMLAQNPVAAVLSSVQIALQVAAIYFVFRPDAKPWFQKPEEVSLAVGGAGGDHSAIYRKVQPMNKTKLYIWIAALAAGSLIWGMLMDVVISGRLSLVYHFGAGIAMDGAISFRARNGKLSAATCGPGPNS